MIGMVLVPPVSKQIIGYCGVCLFLILYFCGYSQCGHLAILCTKKQMYIPYKFSEKLLFKCLTELLK